MDFLSPEDTKTLELSGLGSDDVTEPEEVRVAREELKVLHDEKHRTEKIRGTVQKELATAKSKTMKLQEVSYLWEANFLAFPKKYMGKNWKVRIRVNLCAFMVSM